MIHLAALMLSIASIQVPKPVATPFPLGAVQLLGGPFEAEHQTTARYLLELDPDRLLAGFRANAGLPPKGEIYGGWETGGLSGHSLGHYLTACSQEFARSHVPWYKEKVEAIVKGLDECQQARGDGFLMAFHFENGFDRKRLDQIWADVASGKIRTGGFDLNGMWSPWYVHHKVLAGLLDAYAYLGNKLALTVAKRFADWMIAETKGLSDDQWQRMLGCEYGGTNDSLAELYAVTKDAKYLELSKKFYDRAVLDPLRDGHDDLAGKHSNTQIPKIIGLARLYETTGNPADSKIAEFFWDRVVNHHSYVIGGNSNGEYLGQPDHLSDRLSGNTCETCNTYNMLKLTRHLFAWHPDAKLMDFYERAYYNHILASQDPDSGGVTYFMPLGSGSKRDYSNPFDNFTCCHGTGMENHTKHGDSAYFHAGDKFLWVNLFMPSRLIWKVAGVTLGQETKFPADGAVSVKIEHGDHEFDMLLRHPGWAAGPVDYRLNGKVVATSNKPGSYVSIKRRWKTGDKLDFVLPMQFRYEAMPDSPNRVAVLRGPIVYAASLGSAEKPAPRTPVLITGGAGPNDWLQTGASKQTFEARPGVAQPGGSLEFSPFWTHHHDRYAVYFDLFTQSKWDKAEAEYRAEEAHLRDLEARTVDQCTIGEMQPERDHGLNSEKNDVRDVDGRNFRTPYPGGWFELKLKVDPAKPNVLVFTYWGNDRTHPSFQILVDGQPLTSETLSGRPHNKFYGVEYPIPAAVTQGKSSVVIRVQPDQGKIGPSVAGARIVLAK